MVSLTMQHNGMSTEKTQQLELLPAPQKIQMLKGTFNPAPDTKIWVPEISQKEVHRSADMLQTLLKRRGLPSKTTKKMEPAKVLGFAQNQTGTCSAA